MNRLRSLRSMTGTALMVVLCTLVVVGIATPSLASDNDGISGYSMPLKFKNFDGSGQTSSGGGSLVVGDESTNSIIVTQKDEQVDGLILVLRRFAERWYIYWMR